MSGVSSNESQTCMLKVGVSNGKPISGRNCIAHSWERDTTMPHVATNYCAALFVETDSSYSHKVCNKSDNTAVYYNMSNRYELNISGTKKYVCVIKPHNGILVNIPTNMSTDADSDSQTDKCGYTSWDTNYLQAVFREWYGNSSLSITAK